MKNTPSSADKIKVQAYFQPLVESYRTTYIQKKPNKRFNYLIDVYSKWVKNYFYICGLYKSEQSNRLTDEFEVKFSRLEYQGKNEYAISYFRHTGQWQTIADQLTLSDCLEMIQMNPIFHPF